MILPEWEAATLLSSQLSWSKETSAVCLSQHRDITSWLAGSVLPCREPRAFGSQPLVSSKQDFVPVSTGISQLLLSPKFSRNFYPGHPCLFWQGTIGIKLPCRCASMLIKLAFWTQYYRYRGNHYISQCGCQWLQAWPFSRPGCKVMLERVQRGQTYRAWGQEVGALQSQQWDSTGCSVVTAWRCVDGSPFLRRRKVPISKSKVGMWVRTA